MRGTTDPADPAARPPCGTFDPDLWFAEHPSELNLAKALCAHCPIRVDCLAGALERGEPWGVWGGEIVHEGVVLSYKRGRGRPSRVDRELGLFTRSATGQRLNLRRARLATRPGRAGTCRSRSA